MGRGESTGCGEIFPGGVGGGGMSKILAGGRDSPLPPSRENPATGTAFELKLTLF